MSINNLLSRYTLVARSEGKSPKTIEHVTSAARLFDSFMGGITDVRRVTADDFRRFLAALRDRPKWQGMPHQKDGAHISNTTIHTYGRGVKGFWVFLERDGVVKNNPMDAVKLPKPDKSLPRILTGDELQQSIVTASRNRRDYAMVLLFLDTGIRLGELETLTLDNVDFKAGTVLVKGKGNKQRYAYFQPATGAALDGYIRLDRPDSPSNRVFLSQDGDPLKARRIMNILAGIGHRAGLGKRLSPHKLRHSFATMALNGGASLEHVRLVLGHTTSKVTEVYLHLSGGDLAKAHQTFSPVNQLGIGGRGTAVVGGKRYEKFSPEWFEAMKQQRIGTRGML